MAAETDDIQALQYEGTRYLFSRCLHSIVELGIADSLGDSPETAAALAARAGLHPGALARVLRYLAAGGIFTYHDGHFAHSPQSRLLRADHPKSQRGWFRQLGSSLSWEVARTLSHSIRTGRPATELLSPGGLFGYLSTHPNDSAIFDEGMTSRSRADIGSILHAYDFSACRRVADIGGGRGHLLRAVLHSTPSATGVLFDLPQTLDAAVGVESARLTLHAGDFFRDDLPVCDTYLLMHVIHDWADEEATSILRRICQVCPANGRLLLLENLLPEEAREATVRDRLNMDLDVAMLIFAGGRERTRSEYELLLRSAGWSLNRALETQSGIAILEATPEAKVVA